MTENPIKILEEIKLRLQRLRWGLEDTLELPDEGHARCDEESRLPPEWRGEVR